VPTGTFAWVLKSNPEHYQASERVRLPVYLSDLRERILTFVDVPTTGKKGYSDGKSISKIIFPIQETRRDGFRRELSSS